MRKTRENIKILLLQFRLAKKMREQELRCYLKFSKLNKNQIIPWYILEKNFDLMDLKKFDAVIIGGTGDFGVFEVRDKYPRAFKNLEKIARYCRKNKIPVINVCIQFWAILFGGQIKTDASCQEVGTFTIKLTNEAKKDILFHDMPQEFKAQVGHKDFVSKLPEKAILLAYSNLCPTHAYKIGDREYAFQFHPELDKNALIERMKHYRSYTSNNPEEFDRQINAIEETPECVKLLEKFINRIVLR